MDTKTDNPHDKRFKELFANKKSFVSLLKDCIQEPWTAEIDENSLTKTNNSFILQDFSEKEADVVYEATIEGNTVIFYVLLELQSAVDYRMPYRLLLYIVEILRNHYNQADVKDRERKDFKFPVVFPIVFYTGSGKWTVPLSIKEMFSHPNRFGSYTLDFSYMLLDAKGYDDATLQKFSSKLLGILLMLEKSKTDIEFYSKIRNHLGEIKDFDDEEKRIFNLCIKITDVAYGYHKTDAIKKLLSENLIQEVDSMLCDVIENAKQEKENLKLQERLDIAKNMMLENLPMSIISKVTKLSKEQLEDIKPN